MHRENKGVPITNLSKVPTGSELWQILPASGDEDDELGEHLIAGNESTEDGIPQIIYVSYQDPDDPNQSRTLHFVDVGSLDAKATPGQSLSTLEEDPAEIIAKRGDLQTDQDERPDSEIEMQMSDSNLQLQVRSLKMLYR